MDADTTLTLEQLRDATCIVANGPYRRAFDAAIRDRNALREFAQRIMRAWPEGDVDGGELQDAAEACGLLEPSEPTSEELDEWGLEPGDPWYRQTALLTGCGSARAERADSGKTCIPFQRETWPEDADGDLPNLCTMCGKPVMYGSRHRECGEQRRATVTDEMVVAAMETYCSAWDSWPRARRTGRRSSSMRAALEAVAPLMGVPEALRKWAVYVEDDGGILDEWQNGYEAARDYVRMQLAAAPKLEDASAVEPNAEDAGAIEPKAGDPK